MEYASIIIPTYCRAQHFIRLIESLKRNKWAKFTEIYVGVDYPKYEKDKKGWLEICSFLEDEDQTAFKTMHYFIHDKNIGSAANTKFLVEQVFKEHDRMIYMDDDLESSPNFIEYMDKCLDFYDKDNDVIAISGYSYPLNWVVSDDATVFKEGFICPMWGTGFWKEKYYLTLKYLETEQLKQTFSSCIKEDITGKMTRTCKMEYINLCLSPLFSNTLATRFTDVAARMYMAVNKKYVVLPIISKVRNWGFDGTGEFCKKNKSGFSFQSAQTYEFSKQLIDSDLSFELLPDDRHKDDENRNIMDMFDIPETIPYHKSCFKLFLCNILGANNVSKVISYIYSKRS